MPKLTVMPTPGVREQIVRFLEENEGKANIDLILAPGDYYFDHPESEETWRSVLYGETDYDTPWGRVGHPYHTEMVFRRMRNVRVIGNGAILWMQGLTAPFSFEGCENVTLQGFEVNWKRPPFSVVRIWRTEEKRIYVRPEADFPLHGGEVIWGMYDYDPGTGEVCREYRFRNMSPLRQEEGNLFSFETKTKTKLTCGNTLILRHVGNYRPVLHFFRTSLVYIERVTLYAGAGMGLIAHQSKDMFFRYLSIRPWRNRLMSVTTDSTHFISCSGQISFQDCYFEGAGDDAVNVHGFYLRIDEVLDDHTVKVIGLREDGTQDQIFDAPDAGDEIAFYHAGEQIEFLHAWIDSSKVDQQLWKAELRFKDAIGKHLMQGDMLTRISDIASLQMVHCHVRSQRARGVLSQTRNVLIENCLFELLSGTAVHVTCDLQEGWFESIRGENIAIRGNRIRHCGYADGTYQNASGIAIESGENDNTPGVHTGITIENNDIVGIGNTGIAVMNAQRVSITGNCITQCEPCIDLCAADQAAMRGNKLHNGSIRFRITH